jgi:hypothetical protein
METQVLSRVCTRRLVETLGTFARLNSDIGCLRLSFVRLVGSERLGPDLSHIVPAWEGTDGIRGTARFCMCGQLARADNDEWRAAR